RPQPESRPGDKAERKDGREPAQSPDARDAGSPPKARDAERPEARDASPAAQKKPATGPAPVPVSPDKPAPQDKPAAKPEKAAPSEDQPDSRDTLPAADPGQPVPVPDRLQVRVFSGETLQTGQSDPALARLEVRAQVSCEVSRDTPFVTL